MKKYIQEELGAEVKAFERTSRISKLSELLSSQKVLEELGKKGREIISPEDRFLINTDSFCRRIKSNNIAKITEADIDTILEKTTSIPNIKYKSYVGYVLGYIASQGGQSLKVKTVKNVIENILPEIGDEGGITGPDIVRYARYWNTFL